MVATASYAATSAASKKQGKMTAFEKQATELAVSVNNSISGTADQVLGNLRYSPNGQVTYVPFVNGDSRQTGILANELADRVYNELKAVPREYRERVIELVGLEKVNATMEQAFGNSYMPQDMSLTTYIKAAWNMGGNPLERARNVLDAVGIYFNQESTAVADSVRFNPTLQKISPYVIFGASYSNLTIDDNRLYGMAIGLALAYGMQKAGEIKNEAARKTMDFMMKGMLLLGNAPVGLMYIAAGNERAKGSEAFSEGNTASGVNNLRNARDLELIAGMYSVGNAVTAPTTELTMDAVGNRIKPIVYLGAATVGAGTLAWILANWHKPQAKAAAGVLAGYAATVACGALADGGSGSPPVTPVPAMLAPTAGASTNTEPLTQPPVNNVPTNGTGDAQTIQPGTIQPGTDVRVSPSVESITQDIPTNTLSVDVTASISATLVGEKVPYVVHFTNPTSLACNTYNVINQPGFYTTDPTTCLPDVPINNTQWGAAILNFALRVGTPAPFLDYLTPAAGIANQEGFGITPNQDYQGLQYFMLNLGQKNLILWINATPAQVESNGTTSESSGQGGSGETQPPGGGGETCPPGYEGTPPDCIKTGNQ